MNNQKTTAISFFSVSFKILSVSAGIKTLQISSNPAVAELHEYICIKLGLGLVLLNFPQSCICWLSIDNEQTAVTSPGFFVHMCERPMSVKNCLPLCVALQ